MIRQLRNSPPKGEVDRECGPEGVNGGRVCRPHAASGRDGDAGEEALQLALGLV